MADNSDVRYTNREFETLKDELLSYTEAYYPDTFRDFSEASLGMLYVDMVSYVGDVLSFYTDLHFRETLLQRAEERGNIFEIARQLGYKPSGSRPAFAEIDVYGVVPAKEESGTYVPDFENVPGIRPGMVVATEDGESSFRIPNSIDFSNPDNTQVYELDSFGNPAYFLIKVSAQAISGRVRSTVFEFGSSGSYETRQMPTQDVIGIENVEDAQGNTWREVRHLSQDQAFTESRNLLASDPPSLLSLEPAPRRFVTRTTSNGDFLLVFGGGEAAVDKTLNENLSASFEEPLDPADLLANGYGAIPRNTVLEVTYLEGGGADSNVAKSSLVVVEDVEYDFTDVSDASVGDEFKDSVRVINPAPATGGTGEETAEEIRNNAAAFFSAQNRTVTEADYEARVLALPSRFGGVAKAQATRDADGVVELRLMGYDQNGHLAPLGNTVKENVRQYLRRFRPVGDTVRIMDGYAINFALDIEIRAYKGTESNEKDIKVRVIDTVADYFSPENSEFSEPIVNGDLINQIQNVEGVRVVLDIEYTNKFLEADGYSGNGYDMDVATRDGVIYPSFDPSIFTVRYPDKDIRVRIV